MVIFHSYGPMDIIVIDSGWWKLEHEFYDLPFSWEFHHPN